MSALALSLGLLTVLCLVSGANAFGSGNVPEQANLEGRAFRHGDIAFVLLELVKVSAGGAIAKQLAKRDPKTREKVTPSLYARIRRQFAKHPEKAETIDVKFSEEEVAMVYFGNWLRDLSQALDIGVAKSLGPGIVVNFVSLLGFSTFGRGTREFRVTEERLGCYRHEEHMDNPAGYPDGEPEGADPRELAGGYQGLRGPVRPIEHAIDPKTGMKNYIANESGDWDTSSAYLKKSIVECIKLGRSGLPDPSKRKDEWEAYRLLGQALHVIEDFPAHSNFIELALNKLGHKDVFCYCGDNVLVDSPKDGKVPPLVTGTFGGADAIHSGLGELMDSLNQASVSSGGEKKVKESDSKDIQKTRKMFVKFLGNKGKKDDDDGDDDDEEEEDSNGESILEKLDNARAKVIEFDGEEMNKVLLALYKLHDGVARSLFGKTKLKNEGGHLSTFCFATLEPFISPLIKKVEEALLAASQAVVEHHDLNKEFSDPDFQDPAHSVLAKDHFGNLLNGPGGKLAELMFKHVVTWVSEAWNNNDIKPEDVADRCAALYFHPYFIDEKNQAQKDMLDYIENWVQRQGNEKEEVLSRLTRQSIIDQKNTTEGLEGGSSIRTEIEKSKASRNASLGLWGWIGIGWRKTFACCGANSDTYDDKHRGEKARAAREDIEQGRGHTHSTAHSPHSHSH